jgi:hypothetical protein
MTANRFCIAATLSAIALTGMLAPASAADMAPKGIKASAVQGGLQLSCDNGRSYAILAKGVSDAGEMVTGYLVLAPRKQVYFRLVPMTVGYRYAGQGFWFDGIRNEGALKGKNDSISCTVESKA